MALLADQRDVLSGEAAQRGRMFLRLAPLRGDQRVRLLGAVLLAGELSLQVAKTHLQPPDGVHVRGCLTCALLSGVTQRVDTRMRRYPLEPAHPLYSRDVLKAGASGYGLLWSGLGVGAVLGLLTIPWVGRRSRPGMTFSAIAALWGFFLLPLMFVPNLGAAMVFLGLAGRAWGSYTTIETTLLQRFVPAHQRGHVFGARAALTTATGPIVPYLPHDPQPEADAIENLNMAVGVDQKRLGGRSHSTIGAITDIAPLLRLLYARIGTPYVGSANAFGFNDPQGVCPECNGHTASRHGNSPHSR